MIDGILDFLARMIPGVLLAGVLYAALLPRRKRRLSDSGLVSSWPREILLLLFSLFCGGLALLTLTPRWFHWLTLLTGVQTQLPAFFRLGDANLIPFRTFSADPWSLMILMGNLIMFFPIGFCATLLWRGSTWRRALVIGLLTTFFIEIWQLVIGRAFDVDDLLLNTLGVLLGHLLCQLLRRLAPRSINSFQVQTLAS